MKSSDKKRALLATALLEDESVRLISQANSKAYLREKQEQDKTPFWMWCAGYFALGILFMITFDTVFWSVMKGN